MRVRIFQLALHSVASRKQQEEPMRLILVGMVVAITASAVSAQGTTSVRGYIKKDGTYVAPHVRTNPNNTRLDNYSTAPNYNPYTGKQGTEQPFPTPTYQPYKPYTPPKPKKCAPGVLYC